MSKFLQLFKKKQQKIQKLPKKLSKNSNHHLSPSSIFHKNNPQTPLKINVVNVFNYEQQVRISQINQNFKYNSSDKRIRIFQQILSASVVNIKLLKTQSWKGIPQNYRSLSWKILLKYCPTNQDNIQISLNKKRKDYFSMVQTYIEHPTLQQNGQQKKAYKIISDDVIRTLPETGLFRHELIQKIMQRYKTPSHRILYLWHIRHPSSGYVQGINDTVTPFIVVYLSDFIQLNYQTLAIPQNMNKLTQQNLNIIQADSYWCLCKILDSLLDNYTNSWPGIQKSFLKIKQVIKRIDSQLLEHFQHQGIDFYHLYFKWVTCLLLRQFNAKIGLRLFDTYISDDSNYFNFIMYILIAIILKYSKKFKKMKFQQIMSFQQNMPTKEWTQQDLSTVIAQAFVYQSYFNK